MPAGEATKAGGTPWQLRRCCRKLYFQDRTDWMCTCRNTRDTSGRVAQLGGAPVVEGEHGGQYGDQPGSEGLQEEKILS